MKTEIKYNLKGIEVLIPLRMLSSELVFWFANSALRTAPPQLSLILSTNYFLLPADPRTENTATVGSLTSRETSWDTDETDNRPFYRILKATPGSIRLSVMHMMGKNIPP